MNIFKQKGIREVINANGKMTILGVSVASDEIAENMKNALQNFVVIEELINYTGGVIAKKTNAEAGVPVMGAAAGICISVAAVITGTNLDLIEKIPNTQGLANEIIIQKGQSVNFGGSIVQMISLGGGIPKEVGHSNKTERYHIEGAIGEKTAALLYVVSHHAVQKGMQNLNLFIELGKKYNKPVIVDAAAEEDLEKYIALGADLVIYSGAKAMCGPTSGMICGKEKYIEACKKQYKGIGRAMKVSKESMIGLITAIEDYDIEKTDIAKQKEIVKTICDELNKLDGLECTITKDEAGREIYRASIRFDETKLKISAQEINERLKNGSTAIYLRDYYSNLGVLAVDPRTLLQDQEKIIINEIVKLVGDKKI